MTEKEELLRITEVLAKSIARDEPVIHRLEGSARVWDSEGRDTLPVHTAVNSMQNDLFVKERLIDVVDNLALWTERVEEQSRANHERLLALLGLSPNSTPQEITEAIDDVAPLFADYRRKKRGT